MDTFAMVVSSTCMNVAIANAISVTVRAIPTSGAGVGGEEAAVSMASASRAPR